MKEDLDAVAAGLDLLAATGARAAAAVNAAAVVFRDTARAAARFRRRRRLARLPAGHVVCALLDCRLVSGDTCVRCGESAYVA